ncbi:MAG: peptidyl-prolyl cis-trans isomerase [Gemmatimonadetes bacterium]|nr:peptidyl-prolyl cis-trans isomerase [Gemmatimonadota bacterium]
MLHQMRSAAKYIWIIMAVAFIGGFLLAETSGLLGRSAVTTSTVVAKVNGTEIPYLTWANAAQQMAQQQEQQSGHGLTLDERRQVDDQAFNQLVADVLLQQEYEKRGIRVTDEEIIEQAKYNPPPQFQQAEQLQTDGRFDPAKYQRFLASPAARQQGVLAQLEQFYRTELPRQKLINQLGGDVWVSDTRLWQIYQDAHDSAAVSFVEFRPAVTDSMKKAVTDAEAQAYFDTHKKEYDRPGRAVLSLVTIPRRPTAADSAAAKAKIEALRAEIVKGAKFEEVAKRESDDSVSGKNGGDLGKGPKGRFVPAFDEAAFKLKPGELSGPVQTQFGYHPIRVDSRNGDTISLHHILKLVKQGDSAATVTDRKADSLSKMAASADVPAKFDAAAKALNLLVSKIEVHEGEPAFYVDRQVPSASAWAFGGAKVGESSDLFDDDAGYYLVRLDSLRDGGPATLESVKDEVKTAVARAKAVDAAMAGAKAFAQAAAGSSLEAAAKAKGFDVKAQPMFARSSVAPALGALSEAMGASFALPVGVVSAPVKTETAGYVLRVDKRVQANHDEWEKQKNIQRDQVTRGLREQRVRMFLDGLRRSAKIVDNRKEIQAAQRRQS